MNIFHIYAKKSLKKNRTRTIVTIIGIMLSAAMLTAVTTIISSIRSYGIRYEEAMVGDWQVEVDGVSAIDRNILLKDERVGRVYLLSNLGYAVLPDGQNAYKPYLCIRGMDEAFAAHMPLHLTEGRMPERADEILMPEHVSFNGGVSYALGDTLTLEVGRRVSADGQELWQDTALLYMENSELPEGEHEYRNAGSRIVPLEEVADAHRQTYTVVGFYERPAFEATSAPGYTVLTVDDRAAEADTADLFVVMKHVWDVMPFYGQVSEDYASYRTLCNNSLLRFYGISTRSDFNQILYGMGGILIVIIVVGSVALIYNAFAISIGERTREFGILASIGATRRQLSQTVRYEALRLCVFGIPLGILAGICGIGITLSFFSGVFEWLIGNEEGVMMRISVSPTALFVTAVIGIGTVLLSAHLPMRRALKISAVAAIRQTGDIRLGRRQVRLPLWARGHFAGWGMKVSHELALKSFARNKKSYRATIFSLAMSIVLFVSAGCFSEYLFGGYQSAVDISPYDIQVHIFGEDFTDTPVQLAKVREVDGIAEVYHVYSLWTPMELSKGELTEIAQERWSGEGDTVERNTYLNFLPDDIFAEFVDYYGLDAERYYGTEPRAAVLNTAEDPMEEGRTYQILADSCEKVTCMLELSDGTDLPWELPVGDLVAQELYAPQAFSDRCLSISTYAQSITLIYPESRIEDVFATIESEVIPWATLDGHAFFLADDHAAASERMEEIIGEHGIVWDTAAEEEEYRMVRLMVSVFCDGFIVLLSLIAAANVFNTISTNMNVRRREFAMLRSLGMTPREFADMLNFECVVYGCRGYFAGLFIALPCAVLMYYLGSGSSLEGFYLPVRYPLIAAVCVFVLVYVTMRYGQQKIKQERLMDVLRQ